MKLHDTDPEVDVLGVEFRRLGLLAATKRILRDQKDPGGSDDYGTARVVRAGLWFPGNDQQKNEWLDAMFEVVDTTYGYMHSFDDAAQVTAATATDDFLQRIVQGDDATRRSRQAFLEHRSVDKRPLDSVPAARLIEWCSRQNDPEVWSTIAVGLWPYQASEKDKSCSLSCEADDFLRASPDPAIVLRCYAEKITPNSWSGSRASIMERRAAAFESLQADSNRAISEAAKIIARDARKWIEKERENERRRDEASEQRFE